VRSEIGYFDCGCDFVNALLGRSWQCPRPKGGGKMSLRHRSRPVNRTSPVRLRGRSYQPACDWPVELDTRRLVRPVRRRLVGVILLPRCALPSFGRRIARRVIPAFYPILPRAVCTSGGIPAVMLTADWGRCGHAFDAQHQRPSCCKVGEAHLWVRGIPPRGCEVTDLVQPGWRGELRAWQQAEPDRPVRGPAANPPAVKSSTMKGPRGLASESCRRRCRIANDFG
jgi:hypothetical protein